MIDDYDVEEAIQRPFYDYNQWSYNEYMTFKPGDLVTLRSINLTTRQKIHKINIFDVPDKYDKDNPSPGQPISIQVGQWVSNDIGVILEGVCFESGQVEVLVNETVGWADFEFLKLCESK
jgi:hypothetical protein